MPRAEDYEHLPYYDQVIRLGMRDKSFDTGTTGDYLTTIHPNNSGRIIINLPGFQGAKDGFNDKHRKLAQYMQGEGLGAVIRGKGPGWSDLDSFPMDYPLRGMIDSALHEAFKISGSTNPELMLIGTSAGAGIAAAIAYEYDAITKMLLMAPGDNMGRGAVKRGLRRFTGEVCIVIGQNDANVGVNAGQTFYDLATGASRRKLFIIPDCGHQFEGETNGRIMSQAPFYAFARSNRPKFPDPEGGMVLY